jgi:hypothetical protein
MKRAPAVRWFAIAALLIALVMDIALARPARAAADLAKLQSLRVELEAAAATSESLYQRTGRLLVQLAEAEPADPTVRSNAVAAIRTVTRSSSRLAQRSRRLAEDLEPLPTGIMGTAEQLNEALSSYHAAERDLERYIDELQGRIAAAAAANETPTEFAVELEAFTDSADDYSNAASTFDAVLSNLEDITVGRFRLPTGIRLSVYGFFDERTTYEDGYGLYTHVLFATESDRNVVLLEEVLQNPRDDLFAEQRAAINLFAIPVLNSIKAELFVRTGRSAASDIMTSEVYDYDRARRILGQICLSISSGAPDSCSGDWKGPFLVTHGRYLSGASSFEPPYLLVDLSKIHESAFGEFVRAVKQQVMLPDFTSREKIDTFRLQLLNMTLEAADLLEGPLKEGVKEILALVKA